MAKKTTTVKELLERLVSESGMNQSALASAAKISPGTFSKIKKGQRGEVVFGTMCRLLAAAGKTWAWLEDNFIEPGKVA